MATAEVVHGGLIGDMLTDAGELGLLPGGAIVPATRAGQRLLGVSKTTLQEHGAVSEAVAIEMAAGARRLFDADYAPLGHCGRPDGGTPDKPVGPAYVGLAMREGVGVASSGQAIDATKPRPRKRR